MLISAAKLGTSSGHSKAGLGEWKLMLLSLCITCIPATMATSYMSLLSEDRSDWGKRTEPTEWIILLTWLLKSFSSKKKILLFQRHPLLSIQWDTNIFMFFVYSEESNHRALPPNFLSSIFLFFYLKFIYFWERERESTSKGGAETEGERGSKAGSVLTAESLMQGLNPQNSEIMTWTKVRCLTDWATHMPLSPIFQSCSFQVPDHPAKPLATAHKSAYNRTSGHFSFQAKWTTRHIAQSSAHWESFPPPLSFRDVPERSNSATAVPFCIVPT